jgi:GNAT superfamily N-acetyltransferase
VLAIRSATAADVPVATRIIGDALAEFGIAFDPQGRDADVRLFGSRPDHDDFVAQLGGVPVGLASVGPQGEPGVAWVSKVFVAAGLRRRGVGRTLLERAHDAARARGYWRIGLRTRTVFRDAIALYLSFGYAAAEPDARLVIDRGDVVYFRDL